MSETIPEFQPEDADHRGDFDRLTETVFKGNPLLQVSAFLRASAQYNPAQGSLSKMQTICANEVMKAAKRYEEGLCDKGLLCNCGGDTKAIREGCAYWRGWK